RVRRLAEQHRAAARCRVGWRGAHFTGVVGKVAPDAEDPPDRERGAVGRAHRYPDRLRRGEQVGHQWRGSCCRSMTRYSADITAPAARGLPRSRRIARPPSNITAPTTAPTTTSAASTASPSTPSATRSRRWRGLRGSNAARTRDWNWWLNRNAWTVIRSVVGEYAV